MVGAVIALGGVVVGRGQFVAVRAPSWAAIIVGIRFHRQFGGVVVRARQALSLRPRVSDKVRYS